MILTKSELESLIRVEHATPHQLLGMHLLGKGGGVVTRAFWPGAVTIDAVPTHEPDQPVIHLKRLHSSGLFEGIARSAKRIYAYDLVITDEQGRATRTRDPYSFLPSVGETDIYLFGEGNERRIYEKLGAHPHQFDGVPGVSFAVWAPNARRISVVGDFNGWDGRFHPMRLLGASGVWELFIPGARAGDFYKFEVLNAKGGLQLKTDPFGFEYELAPKTAARVVAPSTFIWEDSPWMEQRRQRNPLRSPLSIYEVHLGSWRKKSAYESLGYRELAAPLIEYVSRLGFTHVEFLPLAEHAYYPSWGYQVTGFYAPTSRYGSPEDLRYLVNELHQAGIGVIIDWVPAHFPRDDWGMARFDGTALYEHEDPRQGAHQDWGTLIFNYGRNEVRNFLIANARFWCEQFHVDGLRVDAVASMLYLDYSRQPGEWVPNRYGGRENLEAIEFLRQFNYVIHTEFPGIITIAEESTAWPQVTRPPYVGGLGFSFKWNMGWMHDTLRYFSRDPIYRKYHQNDLTFAMLYHHNENFILPLSHDEVVHGKRSLIGKMPGDDWRQFANLRTLFGYQWFFPGKKLLFMGSEIGQRLEWNENASLQWQLLTMGPYHEGLRRFVADLNRIYTSHPSLWQSDYDPEGFYWVDCTDQENSIISFIRQGKQGENPMLAILNLTPLPRQGYRVGLPRGGGWREILNSDAKLYGGSDVGNAGGVTAENYHVHNQIYSALFTLPPLGLCVFAQE
jgi:1,4-alpha-glucan branching enzyme